jgi:hypothetical protein
LYTVLHYPNPTPETNTVSIKKHGNSLFLPITVTVTNPGHYIYAYALDASIFDYKVRADGDMAASARLHANEEDVMTKRLSEAITADFEELSTSMDGSSGCPCAQAVAQRFVELVYGRFCK